jgi:hypothetical protein
MDPLMMLVDFHQVGSTVCVCGLSVIIYIYIYMKNRRLLFEPCVCAQCVNKII